MAPKERLPLAPFQTSLDVPPELPALTQRCLCCCLALLIHSGPTLPGLKQELLPAPPCLEQDRCRIMLTEQINELVDFQPYSFGKQTKNSASRTAFSE